MRSAEAGIDGGAQPASSGRRTLLLQAVLALLASAGLVRVTELLLRATGRGPRQDPPTTRVRARLSRETDRGGRSAEPGAGPVVEPGVHQGRIPGKESR